MAFFEMGLLARLAGFLLDGDHLPNVVYDLDGSIERGVEISRIQLTNPRPKQAPARFEAGPAPSPKVVYEQLRKPSATALKRKPADAELSTTPVKKSKARHVFKRGDCIEFKYMWRGRLYGQWLPGRYLGWDKGDRAHIIRAREGHYGQDWAVHEVRALLPGA